MKLQVELLPPPFWVLLEWAAALAIAPACILLGALLAFEVYRSIFAREKRKRS